MAMTLGEELKRLIPESKQQKVLAIEWLEAWKTRHPKHDGWSTDTAETRLSQCLRDRIDGVRFYFGDHERRETTYQMFDAAPEDRRRLDRLADASLAEERPARLVADVSPGPQAGKELDDMFEAMKALFLADDAPAPLVLLVTTKQYDRVPRSFDDHKARLLIERVPKPEAARVRVGELVAAGAVAATPYPFLPYHQWLAIRFAPALACDPPDGLAVLAESGALPALPEVTMPLARIVVRQSASHDLPTKDPFELRALMRLLALGEGPQRDPYVYYSHNPNWAERARAMRLSWAEQLGITAAATHEEWVEALPARIAPVPLLTSPVLLDHARWLARFTGAPAVFAFEKRVIALNPPDVVRADLTTLGAVEVEEIAREDERTIARMLDEATAMTEEDLLDDPFLDALVDRYASEPNAGFAVEATRHALLCCSEHRAAPAPVVEDWRGALSSLLDGTVPEAMLRLRMVRSAGFVAPDKPGAQWSAPPRVDVLFARDQRLLGLQRYPERGSTVFAPDLKGPREGWAGQILDCLRLEGQQLRGPSRSPGPWWATPMPIGDEIWDQADRELAVLLGALRVAVTAATPLPLPGGRVMVPLGGGILAEVRVRSHPKKAGHPPVGSLVLPIACEEKAGWNIQPLMAKMPTHWAAGSRMSAEIGVSLPHGARLAGCGFAAEVTLRTSPLFTGIGAQLRAEAAPSAAAVLAVELRHREDEEQRRRDEDDDD